MGFALRPSATRRKVGGFSFSCRCLPYPCIITSQLPARTSCPPARHPRTRTQLRNLVQYVVVW